MASGQSMLSWATSQKSGESDSPKQQARSTGFDPTRSIAFPHSGAVAIRSTAIALSYIASRAKPVWSVRAMWMS